MKEKIKKIIIASVLIITVGYLGYHFLKKDNLKETNKPEQAKSQEEVITEELAKRYNAITDWDKNINYSVQLQELLVDSGKPVLFVGSVDDIFKKDNKYFIVFTTYFSAETDIRFTLECPEAKISEILDKTDENPENSSIYLYLFGDYVVVAKINNINKTKLQISGSSNGEDVELGYSSSDVFIADGNCIDFSYIEENK